MSSSRAHAHIYPQVWRQRCCATGDRLGTGSVFALTRWDKTKKPAVDNLVLFNSAAMADQFDEQVRVCVCAFCAVWLWCVVGCVGNGRSHHAIHSMGQPIDRLECTVM